LFTLSGKAEVIQELAVCHVQGSVELMDDGLTVAFMLREEGYIPANFNRPQFQHNPLTILAHGTLIDGGNKFDGLLGELPANTRPHLLAVEGQRRVRQSSYNGQA
jgi:hypothetical protein